MKITSLLSKNYLKGVFVMLSAMTIFHLSLYNLFNQIELPLFISFTAYGVWELYSYIKEIIPNKPKSTGYQILVRVLGVLVINSIIFVKYFL